MKAQSLHFSKTLITEDKIARVHREGFLVYAYTIDAPNQMSRFMKMGMDGLFTNYPDRLSRVKINDRKIK
jgi:glycerophosphoryl diester phosphodiesterase